MADFLFKFNMYYRYVESIEKVSLSFGSLILFFTKIRITLYLIRMKFDTKFLILTNVASGK